MKKICILLLFTSFWVQSQAQSISAQNVLKHIKYLASDKLEGRAPGSKGDKLAQAYIVKHFTKLGLTPLGTNGYLQAFSHKMSMNPHEPNPNGKLINGCNIAAFLDNGAENTIIIGGHYDHLGTDGFHASLEANPEGKIHNGADDNASGTAGVLELARHFATNDKKEAYNFLFLCFSAEEEGLIGSKYFTEHPTLDLNKVHFMINMDMIGRLNDSTQTLIVMGTGTSAAFETTLKNTPTPLHLKLDSAGVGPSDHTSFYLKNIPVLFFFTGQHTDYHKPSDDWQKINAEGEAKVLDFIVNLTQTLCTMPKLTFLETKAREDKKVASFKVTLGIMPDYANTEEGVHVDGVTDNKPAFKAGIKKGDMILQIGEYKIKDIYDYMDALAKFKKGDKTTVIFRQKGVEKTAEVEF